MLTMNGWPTGAKLEDITAGTTRTEVRAGDVAVVLEYVARRFHDEVEPIVTHHGWRSLQVNKDSGGIWNSNHLSGTADDINGGLHPRFKAGTFSPRQVAIIRDILHECRGVVVWGGDWGRSVDEMHFEIRGSAVAVAAVAARLRPTDTVHAIQGAVHTSSDGFWGEDTDRRLDDVRAALNGQFPHGVKTAQQVIGTTIDGLWGPNSIEKLGRVVAAIQTAIGVFSDGYWGAETEAAYRAARQKFYLAWEK